MPKDQGFQRSEEHHMVKVMVLFATSNAKKVPVG